MTRTELASRLRAAGIEDYAEEAKRLFCHYSGMSRAAALAEPGADCTAPALLEALRRREAREPLSYLLGEAAFWEETYRVSPACLIPRPETELLVERAITALPQGGHFADLCTGSGCIAISTLAHRKDATADGYDISPAALALAHENAVRNDVADRLHLAVCDLLTEARLAGPYDMILSNPPYVTDAEWEEVAPELHYEPRAAFLGGADGLCFYRRILSAFAPFLKAGGCFIFEIGWRQGESLRRLATEHKLSCEICRDYGGRDRMAVLR